MRTQALRGNRLTREHMVDEQREAFGQRGRQHGLKTVKHCAIVGSKAQTSWAPQATAPPAPGIAWVRMPRCDHAGPHGQRE